jgi:NADH:ubiquinone reductase (H+-translocating)
LGKPGADCAAPHHIVIAGGGAGGLELATRLGDTLGRRGAVRVTLVDCSRTHVWKPLLHAVAAGTLRRSQHELNYLAQAHWHHFTYRFGEVTGIDRARQQLIVAAMRDEEGRLITPETRLGYDTLVMAVGSVTNDFGTPGVREYAVPLETPQQASRFNRRLVNAFLRANTQAEPVRPGQLDVVIIGAGATGTELAAELHQTVREVVSYGLDRIDPTNNVRIVLLEAAPRILPALPEHLSNAARRLLESLGVEVRTAARVASVAADRVRLASGEEIPTELVVWSAGVKAPEFLKTFGDLEVNRINQLAVTPTLQTTRDPNIFAIGDCAACPLPDSAGTVPPRAQAAHQQASHMLRQVKARLAGRPLQPYRYRDFGSLVALGRYSTVGNLMGALIGENLFIEGLFARFIYRSLYQMHLAALHGRAATFWRSLVSGLADRPTPTVKLH